MCEEVSKRIHEWLISLSISRGKTWKTTSKILDNHSFGPRKFDQNDAEKSEGLNVLDLGGMIFLIWGDKEP